MSEIVLSERAKAVLESTCAEAANRGLPEYETEELLGQLFSIPSIKKLLRAIVSDENAFIRFSQRVVREAVRRLGEFRNNSFVHVEPKPSSVCREVIDLAGSLAREEGTSHINSVHLLLAMLEVDVTPNIGKEVLLDAGVTASAVRLTSKTMHLEGERDESQPGAIAN